MSKTKINEQIIKRYFEEVWNQGKVDVLDEIVAPSYVNHNPGAPHCPPGPEGLKPIVLAIRQAFPDLNYTIENIVATESQVAVHCQSKVETSGF
jgi:predicted SnoaL-like aldol condensation-catalyzing enzyme